jgi:D-glycero-D-manno-heptose 1,7-bisphosphate phosphatase
MGRFGGNVERAGNKFILLDRDGVINADRPGSVLSVDDFALLPDVDRAIALLNRKGYRVLVITNQACVGRGELTLRELDRIHVKMREQLAASSAHIDEIFLCPHTDADGCDCRKPRPGLVKQAQLEFGFEPRQTWLVGDDRRDIRAALAADCRPALVRTGKGRRIDPPPAVPVFADLMDFAQQIDYADDKQ